MPKIRLDGIEYEAAQEVINAHSRAVEERDRLKTRLDSMQEAVLDGQKAHADPAVIAALEKAKGERDALKERLDAAEKKVSPESIQAAVNTRVRVLEAGRRVLDKDTVQKLDSLDNLTVMKAVIVEAAPAERRDSLKTSLSAASAEYVQARFDAACEIIPAAESAIDLQRQQVIPPRSGQRADSAEDAQNKMRDDMYNAARTEGGKK